MRTVALDGGLDLDGWMGDGRRRVGGTTCWCRVCLCAYAALCVRVGGGGLAAARRRMYGGGHPLLCGRGYLVAREGRCEREWLRERGFLPQFGTRSTRCVRCWRSVLGGDGHRHTAHSVGGYARNACSSFPLSGNSSGGNAIASGVLREKRGSPEAGDHDTGLITYARGLSGAGEGRHEGDVGMERR